jgi:hypothetical protein
MEAAAATRDESRPTLVEAAAIAVVISTALNALGVFTEVEIHWVNLLVGFLMASVAAAIVFGWFVRRASRPSARGWPTGLVFAVLALITVPAFWSGLPPVFGVAAIYLGRRAWRAGSRMGIAVSLLGAVAIVLDAGAYATDVATRV